MRSRYSSAWVLLLGIFQAYVRTVESHLGRYRDVLGDNIIEHHYECTTTPSHAIDYPRCLPHTLNMSSHRYLAGVAPGKLVI